MGLFSFVKGVGKKLGIGDEEEAPKAEELKAELDSHGLGTEEVVIEVEGDKAVLKGAVADQAAFEKAIMAVGNTLGVAHVETDSLQVAAASGSEPTFHEVKSGDTLWAIAEATMGNGAKYEEIFEANKPMLSHPDKIYPGQKLRIPQSASA